MLENAATNYIAVQQITNIMDNTNPVAIIANTPRMIAMAAIAFCGSLRARATPPSIIPTRGARTPRQDVASAKSPDRP